MPPWHVAKTVGIREFKNDRSLTDQQIETIVQWADAGAPKGDPKDMPAPKVWPDDSVWNFAKQFGGRPESASSSRRRIPFRLSRWTPGTSQLSKLG